jgi:hypothetical protein
LLSAIFVNLSISPDGTPVVPSAPGSGPANTSSSSNTSSGANDNNQGVVGNNNTTTSSSNQNIGNSYNNNNKNSSTKSQSQQQHNSASIPISSGSPPPDKLPPEEYAHRPFDDAAFPQDDSFLYSLDELEAYPPPAPPPAPSNKRQREKQQNELKTQQVLSEFHMNSVKMEAAVLSPSSVHTSQHKQSAQSSRMFNEFDRPSSTNAFDIAERVMSQNSSNVNNNNFISSPSNTYVKNESYAQNTSSSNSSSNNSGNKKKMRKYTHGSASNLNIDEAAQGNAFH